MENYIPSFELSKDETLWIKEIWEHLLITGRVPDYRQVRLKTKDFTATEFDPRFIDRSLVNKNATEITLLGVLQIEPEERIFEDANKIINTTKNVLREDWEAKEIYLKEIAEEAHLNEVYATVLFRLISFYGSFWSNAGSKESGYFGFEHFTVGQDDNILEAYLQFKDCRSFLNKYFQNLKLPKSHNFPNSFNSNATCALLAGSANLVPKGKFFIDPGRVQELISVDGLGFDLGKLVGLCGELNDNFNRGNLYSTSLLLRAIIDHVPPVLGCSSFKEIVNNYKSEKNARSFKRHMDRLDNSLRPIGDTVIHSQIRVSESTLNETQLDFKNDLDVLLGEVVRVLKVNNVNKG